MTTLLENPLPALVVGGLLATLGIIVFSARRNAASLAALVAVIAMSAALVLIERFVTTEREQVENALAAVLDSIEANDIEAVVDAIDPAAAKMRSDVRALMPMIKVEKANAMGAVAVDVDDGANPPAATTQFQAFLDGVHERSGMRVAYFNQRVDLHWVKRGDRWLLDDYTAYYQGQPIDAVGSAAGNRAIPAR